MPRRFVVSLPLPTTVEPHGNTATVHQVAFLSTHALCLSHKEIEGEEAPRSRSGPRVLHAAPRLRREAMQARVLLEELVDLVHLQMRQVHELALTVAAMQTQRRLTRMAVVQHIRVYPRASPTRELRVVAQLSSRRVLHRQQRAACKVSKERVGSAQSRSRSHVRTRSSARMTSSGSSGLGASSAFLYAVQSSSSPRSYLLHQPSSSVHTHANHTRAFIPRLSRSSRETHQRHQHHRK